MRHFDCKSTHTIEYIIDQIDKCPIWVSRSAALKFLALRGIGMISRGNSLERIYALLDIGQVVE